MNATIVDVLIENIKTDQNLLEAIEVKIEKEKEAKREITDRLKGYRKDLSVLFKYADNEQRKKIEDLGFEVTDKSTGLNPVAQIVFEIILKAKDNQMENGKLYDAYTKAIKAKKQDPINYTEFNIKCRSLFNTQRLLRKKGKDAKNSREDIISLNGRVLERSADTKTKNDG
jgi:hypothetical protein